MKKSVAGILTLLAFMALPALANDGKEEACQRGQIALETYKRTWSDRIDRETSPAYCDSVDKDAQRAAPQDPGGMQ